MIVDDDRGYFQWSFYCWDDVENWNDINIVDVAGIVIFEIVIVIDNDIEIVVEIVTGCCYR